MDFGLAPLCQDLEPDSPIDGRITGGGSIFVADISSSTTVTLMSGLNGGGRTTRGFQLRFNTDAPKNLQINGHFQGKHNFHLTELISANCIDHANLQQGPPPSAPFDTFVGFGVGRLDGVDGAHIRFVLIDDGEPGTTDMGVFQVWAPGEAGYEDDLTIDDLDTVVAAGSDLDGTEVILTPDAEEVFYISGLVTKGNFQTHDVS